MARVLIIDDSSDMLAMLRMFFERRTPHEVLLSKNGREGLDLAFEQRPDLALVDVMMPGVDGYEVVRQLRADPRTEKMGIIILTARGQSVDQQAALQAGADIHLPKPVNMQTLSESVEALLSARKQASARKPMVLPVFSLKGGLGVTTVAVNLAALLHQIAPTVLWDLSPVSGHGALFVGVQPKTHWGLYLGAPQKGIEPLLRQHRSGLQVFCAPPIPGASMWFDNAQIATVTQGLLALATYVVVDMPSTLDRAMMSLLDDAEKILLLAGDDPPSIQTTLATFQALKTMQEKVLVIHNTRMPGRRTDTATLQAAMRVPIFASLPYDPNQELALGRGVPLALAKPDSPLITGLKSIAQRLLTA